MTFRDTVTFHLNGDEATAIHVPNAHTDGDSIIHFRAGNVVHMGDTYFNGLYPFIDTGTNGSVKGMIAAADRALAITDDTSKIIPGHGPLSNKAELEATATCSPGFTPTSTRWSKPGRRWRRSSRPGRQRTMTLSRATDF